MLDAGTALYRIHDTDLLPLWFGDLTMPPRNRFDDPQRQFGVTYLALSREGAFAETFLRRIPARFISRTHADRRSMATVRLSRAMTVCLVQGRGLPRLGATAAISAGDQAAARAWSRAIWEHFPDIDGLQYRTRYDNDEIALAVYDRASDALELTASVGIRTDRDWFAAVLERYGLGLAD